MMKKKKRQVYTVGFSFGFSHLEMLSSPVITEKDVVLISGKDKHS